MAKDKSKDGTGDGAKAAVKGRLLTAEEHAANRRDARNRKRRGPRGLHADTMIAGLAQDRRERAEQLEQKNRERVFKDIRTSIRAMHWSAPVKDAAATYAALLLGLDYIQADDDVVLRESVLNIVREMFCESILCAQFRPKRTPGQLAEWYPEVLEAVKAANRESDDLVTQAV